MRETLLFDNCAEMTVVLEKILAAYPATKLIQEARGESTYYPVGLDLGTLDQRTWFEWCLNNNIFQFCCELTLLTFHPPEWMQYVIQAHRYKEAAKKLSDG